jgi:BirA family biotin operon repressor/biotin-[acetyl-CoA-carboxylase] ligase
MKGVLSGDVKGLCFESLESTQDYVKNNLASLSHNTFVQALTQTKGRGRRGNTWISPPGGLYITLFLRPPEEVLLLWMPLAFTLWTHAFIEERFGISLRVKWPNDLWLNQAKLGGLLCERIPLGFLVGLGLNLKALPAFPQAASLETCLSAKDLASLGQELVCFLIERFQSPISVESLREAYLERALIQTGDRVSFEENGFRQEAVVLGLGLQATLDVCHKGKKKMLFAGEVQLIRPLKGPDV